MLITVQHMAIHLRRSIHHRQNSPSICEVCISKVLELDRTFLIKYTTVAYDT